MAREAAWLTADKQRLAAVLLQSHQRAFGRPLIASAQPGQPKRLLCQNLFACGFPVLAHGTEQDPALSYANAAALLLWDSHWDGLIGMPSRLTAPDSERAERSSALGQAKRLDAAGELPLAEDPRFADARSTFLNNLKAHGQASAQKAMLQAMAAGS